MVCHIPYRENPQCCHAEQPDRSSQKLHDFLEVDLLAYPWGWQLNYHRIVGQKT